MHIDNRNLFFNRVSYGLLVGFLMPILSFVMYYMFRFGHTTFLDYIHILIESKKIANVLSLSVLPNLAPFMLLINSSRYSSGRGVLAATIVLGVIIFILKFTL
ncbi:MAG: hypothetical protein NTV75_04515 [Bacteroidia bacterium]|nr:hypothetical protein [Bacteroidia bacterium]